jgi:flagellar hook-basal body complex protein FliE
VADFRHYLSSEIPPDDLQLVQQELDEMIEAKKFELRGNSNRNNDSNKNKNHDSNFWKNDASEKKRPNKTEDFKNNFNNNYSDFNRSKHFQKKYQFSWNNDYSDDEDEDYIFEVPKSKVSITYFIFTGNNFFLIEQ